MTADAADDRYGPYRAVAAEMAEAATLIAKSSEKDKMKRDAPGAACIEIAKILTRFETQIDDEWRHVLIMMGGALFLLDPDAEKDLPLG